MTRVLPIVIGTLLSGCAAWETGGGANHLDNLVAGRCAGAQETIARLRDTADLYEAQDLTHRLHRATRLAEIWCADQEDLQVPIASERGEQGMTTIPEVSKE